MVVPILAALVVLFVGLAVWGLMQKQAASADAEKSRQAAEEARNAAEKAEGRVKELDRKLAKSKEHLDAQRSAESGLDQRVKSLEEENRKLRDTIERTSGRGSDALGENTQLREQVRQLERALAEARAQADATEERVETARVEVAEAERARRDQVLEDLKSSGERDHDVATKAYREKVEALVRRYHSMRDRLARAEKDLRIVRRKAEHNHRAYQITRLQLEVEQDRAYTLEHGHPPSFRKKRVKQALQVQSESDRRPRGSQTGEGDIEEAPELDGAELDGVEMDGAELDGAEMDEAGSSAGDEADAGQPADDGTGEDDLAADLEELASRAASRGKDEG